MLSGDAPLVTDAADDLRREVAFYNMTLDLVRSGRDALVGMAEPYKRPKDFFCEMAKSDTHMAKVKENVLFQQKKMEAFEQRKVRQSQLKYHKAVQADKTAEKSAAKKDRFKQIEDFRKEATKKRGSGLKDDDDELPDFKKGPNNKQKHKDSKWGYGGVQKDKKKTDKRSLNDMGTYDPKRGKAGVKGGKRKAGGGGGGKAGGGGKRPRK